MFNLLHIYKNCIFYYIGRQHGTKRGTLKMKNDAIICPSQYEFFLEFYEKYKKMIYHFARQCEPKCSDIDDLVQDVVVRLMNYIPNLMKISDSPNRVAHYIALTVKSVYVDRLRASQTEHCVVLPVEMLEAIYEDDPNRLERPDSNVAQWDVALLKKKLPKRDWDILSGKYIMGYSDKELAVQCGCSQDSIRMALTRARRNARKLLDGEGR